MCVYSFFIFRVDMIQTFCMTYAWFFFFAVVQFRLRKRNGFVWITRLYNVYLRAYSATRERAVFITITFKSNFYVRRKQSSSFAYSNLFYVFQWTLYRTPDTRVCFHSSPYYVSLNICQEKITYISRPSEVWFGSKIISYNYLVIYYTHWTLCVW